ncbi:MAG: isopentenyl-diphosphate Delta-isomerase [Pseudomonadota bacterium]
MGHQKHDAQIASDAIMIPVIADDGSLYPMEKMAAHRSPNLHLAVSIFVFDLEGKLLIQRRADHKYHCGGKWANTCCSHPHWGEDINSAAHRRLGEELGFEVPLSETRVVEYSADVGSGLWEWERVHMFRADVARGSVEPEPNSDEVSETRWVSAAELSAEIAEDADDFAPWFRIYVERFPTLNF